MATTELRAHRVSRGVPIWDILATRSDVTDDCIGVMSHLPMEGAWCLSARYRGREFDFRAASREAVLLALRCAVDATDHAAHPDMDEDPIEDEDGSIAHMRMLEARAEMGWMAAGYDQEPY